MRKTSTVTCRRDCTFLPISVHPFWFSNIASTACFFFLSAVFLINNMPYPKIYSRKLLIFSFALTNMFLFSSGISIISSVCVCTYFICELSSFCRPNTLLHNLQHSESFYFQVLILTVHSHSEQLQASDSVQQSVDTSCLFLLFRK